jgi:cytochrome c oxidase cbb3-type subunit III
MSRTRDQVLGHADEADGIEEYDNALPTWWLGLLYFTIAWAIVYGAHYHFVAERSQVGAYDQEVAAAAVAWPAPDPAALVSAASGEDAVEAGKAVYAANCVGCHGPELKGGIGPDLTDTTWIHGGTLTDINQVITKGVPEKGMLTWGPILGPQKVAQVAAYVHAAGGGQAADAAPAVAPPVTPAPAPSEGGG